MLAISFWVNFPNICPLIAIIYQTFIFNNFINQKWCGLFEDENIFSYYIWFIGDWLSVPIKPTISIRSRTIWFYPNNIFKKLKTHLFHHRHKIKWQRDTITLFTSFFPFDQYWRYIYHTHPAFFSFFKHNRKNAFHLTHIFTYGIISRILSCVEIWRRSNCEVNTPIRNLLHLLQAITLYQFNL